MTLLESVNSPADLRSLSNDELKQLAKEIRAFLVCNVSKTGGHLGPNLGVVELSIALHRVFDSPKDAILFDTGHQTYVHKILTGRKDFSHLRERGGLSGYTSRAESEHDIIENSHATTSLSWADGISRARQLAGDKGAVVAVIGDGALTGGMAWEALNNIAETPHRPLIIVVNDNGRSYEPTVGGFMRRLPGVRRIDNMRVDKRYEDFLARGKRVLKRGGKAGEFAYDALHGLKAGVKDALFDAGIFASLNIKYLGPVNGHNISELEEAFTMAKNFGEVIVVHTITQKGRGYKPAEQNVDDHLHAVGKIHPETGLPIEPSRFGWTAVVAEELLKRARKDPKLVGVTAAMLLPVGLGPMRDAYPDRVFDVGIAEQHALTMSAGLAYAGMKPVVLLYATFMNRGFDQLLMDIALHKEPVTIALDRAGITGGDGASHNGMWDLAIAADIPGLHVAVPRDGMCLRRLLQEAIDAPQPTIIRYPKGSLPADLPAIRAEEGYAVLHESAESRDSSRAKPIVLMGLGPMAHTAMQAARNNPDISCIVVDPEWVLPIPESLVDLVVQSAGLVTLEDGVIDGGIGQELALRVTERGASIPIRHLGVAKEFLSTDSRENILAEHGMDEKAVTEALKSVYSAQLRV